MSLFHGINAETVRQLRQWQTDAWTRGEQILVEQLLARLDERIDDEAVLDLIMAEVLLREEAGQVPTVAEYIERFPQFAESLPRQFEVHQLLGSLDGLRAALPQDTCQIAGLQGPGGQETDPDFLPPHDTSTSMPEVPGYRILKELGRGGMGVVYQAQHLQLNRIVALKMIRDSALSGNAVRDRFRVEAKSVARLQHPNIVQIYDCSELYGIPYFSLEYVAGGTLAEWTEHQPQPVTESARLVETLARAVQHAHQQGIVHRDLKPANILLSRSGDSSCPDVNPAVARVLSELVPKISDFGLAKSLVDDQALTHSDTLLGTCAYMSPEQAWGRSRDVGPATDVHALGLILYELLTGVSPFQSTSMATTLDAVRFTEPIPPSGLRPEVPEGLDQICLRCLNKEPALRYQSAGELADELHPFAEGLLTGRSPGGKRSLARHRITLTVAGIALVALLAWGLSAGWLQSLKSSIHFTDVQLAATGPTRTTGEQFAFLVGVRSYRLPGQSIDLDFTESDVDELSRVLFKHGFQRKNIRLLTQWSESDNPQLAPTKDNIRTQLSKMLKSCIASDTVIVAVTGMGGDMGSPAMYCYLPADGQPTRPESMLTLADFCELFRDCPANRKLLLVDTCQTVSANPIDWPRQPDLPPDLAIYFACAPHEASYEHESLRHGVFSYHILKALEGAADNDYDGIITLDELVNYTTPRVEQFVSTKYPGATQSPRLINSLPGSTPLVDLSK